MQKGRFLKFLDYYKPYKRILFTDLFCATVAAATALTYPILVRYITSTAVATSGGMSYDLIIKMALFFLALIVIEYGCMYYVAFYGHIMGAKMEYNMRSDLFGHFQKLSFSYYDNQKTGQLMSRITTDLFDVTELAHHGPEDIIISIVKIVGAFVILMNINVPLTLIIFLILPFMVFFSIHYNKKMKIAFKKNRVRISEINAQIEDSISGVRAVKSFANEDVENKKFKIGNDHFIESKTNSYKYLAGFQSGLTSFISLLNLLIIVGGALFIKLNIITAADLITFLLYNNLLVEPVKKLINFTEQFQNGSTGFERFMEIMEIEPDIKDAKGAVDLTNVKGDITFENVSFTYNENDKPFLTNLNLAAKQGEYMALVGPSGVGKTTMLSLIPRFYEVSSGNVLIDGLNIKDIKLKSLRNNIGVVQQDVYLFTGTIKDNIRYGKIDATDEEIIQAAKNANAHDFIMETMDGYDTDIGQRGVKLSGGQKQRLSIARVFLKNPPILIFDEATSSLDNESERVVQESFERLAKNRTTFVIAHRLSTIKNAKRILVLTDEGITESGDHETLLAQGGVYATLYNLQFRED